MPARVTCSFTSALRDGNEITEGAAVTYEIGVDQKSGKAKADGVDLV
jgi:hypothetical protein